MVDLRRAAAVGPAESAVFGDHGVQLAPAGPVVVAVAGEKQCVGIGAAARGPVRGMVHFAAIARFQAIGAGAAAVARVADQPLVGGGEAFLAAQIQGPAGVLVEHRQVVNRLGGHANQIPHGQP